MRISPPLRTLPTKPKSVAITPLTPYHGRFANRAAFRHTPSEAFTLKSISSPLLFPALILATTLSVPVDAAEPEYFPIPFDVGRPSINIVLAVDDGPAMREFYGDTVGLQEGPPIDMPDGTAMLRFRAGMSEIKLRVPNANLPHHPGGEDSGRGIRKITLFLPQASGVLNRLKETGHATDDFDTDEDGVIIGSVRDPEDNQIEFKLFPVGTDATVFNTLEIGLTVGNVHESRLYYGDMLRLKEIAPLPGGDVRPTTYRFQAGYTTIKFSYWGELPDFTGAPDEAYGYRAIEFLVRDIDAVHDVMEVRDADIAEVTAIENVARLLYLKDPDGNYIAFLSPPKT